MKPSVSRKLEGYRDFVVSELERRLAAKAQKAMPSPDSAERYQPSKRHVRMNKLCERLLNPPGR
ncbi:MAG: hypothetical protein O2967_18340 [Proteobacteria bacterium]|nr:hypothetical protein [Pseudomonadota bacterium]